MGETPLLDPAEVTQVLSGDPEGRSQEQTTGPGPQPYSLREALVISTTREDEARATMQILVARLNTVLRGKMGESVELLLDGLQQHRVETALATVPDPVWVVPLTCGRDGGLAVALSPLVALALVDLVLGGAGELPESGREPTELEAHVITRLIAAAASGWTETLGEAAEPLELTTEKTLPAVAAPGETVGVGLLRFRIGEGEHSSLLLVTASLLLPALRRQATTRRTDAGELAARLEKVAFSTRAVLPAGQVGTCDLLDLEPGKVLRLDAAEDSRFELRVAGRAVALGDVTREDDRAVFTLREKLTDTEGSEEA